MSDPEEAAQEFRSELEEAKHRLSVLEQGALDAIITIDQSGIVMRWNPKAEVIFGWASEEAVGKTLAQLIIPLEHRAAHAEGMERFLATGHHRILNTRIEVNALRKDNSLFPAELTVLPIQLQHGYEFTAVVRDMTKRKRTTLALQEAYDRYEDWYENSPDFFATINVQTGSIESCNSTLAGALGKAKGEIVGGSVFDLYAPESIATAKQALAHFREFGVVHNSERKLQRSDGSTIDVILSVSPIRDAKGEIVASRTVWRDITERKKLEDAQLRLQEELKKLIQQRTEDLDSTRSRLELALEAANIGLWDWNAETDEVYYSDTYKTQIGYPIDTPWNHFKHWHQCVHEDDREGALQRVNGYFANPLDEYRSTFRLRCKDGSYRWILAQGQATFSSEGTPLRMLGVHIDITQRVSNEQELMRLNEALAEANEALQKSNVELQQFAYVASHDLQTPLRAIAGFTQLLANDYSDQFDETASNYLHRVVNGAKRMQTMINDLLEFSRVESRAAPFAQVDMDSVFEDAVELLSASISDTNGKVTSDPLPTIAGDQSQLAQLFQNLIGNGLKYCEECPVVHVSAEQGDDEWIFSIRDNGIGIDSKHHEKVFEVFRRLHSREAYPGTGIGLAICRRIIQRHGGRIWVESNEGQGSVFFFSIPSQAEI